ncbi:hypothetical protein JQ596_12060 [Bradyrhizobium manausense]|uniref:hypothetical protein n=1 Tax=Bradyrhizobium TaxID=374 RepID=UPI001BAA4718|nr:MULTISPECIES: hypothetical protein [Bradyrhizobium]MBR0826275.1 hypothetical protein [Bradyrhizobium manausense]UVO31713.1 hypothetical protein KUF59_14375 [Bradyrhizobium arachidis]
MSFGKRQSEGGAAVPIFGGGMAAARSQDFTERRWSAISAPILWLFLFVACCVLLYALVSDYGLDIQRDHRLAGTWQPAHDLRIADGACGRTKLGITFCNVKIKSVTNPDQAPITHESFMLFAKRWGEALVPIRSTKDRTAVSISYAAETELWNRTLSFMLPAGLITLFGLGSLALFLRSDMTTLTSDDVNDFFWLIRP